MNCPTCGRYLGEGMLPARCPTCGTNLANPTDSIRGSKAMASRRNVEGLTGIGKGNTSNRRRHYVQVTVALLLAIGGAALLLFALRGFGAEGDLTVPDVVGWRQDRATDELVRLGYGVVVETVYDEAQMEGVVSAQEPLPGVAAVPGSQVRITVATSRIMPNVIGLTREDAEGLLQHDGIPYAVREQLSDQALGTVIEASAPEGNALAMDQTVDIVVAVPPIVPELVGKPQAEAVSLIEAQGLVARVVNVVPDEGVAAQPADAAAQQATADQQAPADAAAQGTDPAQQAATPQDGAAPAAGSVVAQVPDAQTVLPLGAEVQIQVAISREDQLRQAADTVLQAVYNTDPQNDAVGTALQPLMSPDSPYADLDAHDLWWAMVKRGGRSTDQPSAFQSLPRSLESSELTVDPQNRTVTAKITVTWDWSGLPNASSGTSQDTRTVTLRFDKDGKLIDLVDEQTDVPFLPTATTGTETTAESAR